MRHLTTAILIVVTAGCGMKPLDQQVKKSPDSIVGKTTQNIGEFKPEAGAKVSDSKIHATDVASAGLASYGPMLEKISKLEIEHAVNLFHASEDRYPKDYDEFMTRIIKENNIKLPVLPGTLKYQYDVQNHKLEIVEVPAEAK
jgi:hypothetical protein